SCREVCKNGRETGGNRVAGWLPGACLQRGSRLLGRKLAELGGPVACLPAGVVSDWSTGWTIPPRCRNEINSTALVTPTHTLSRRKSNTQHPRTCSADSRR